MNLSKILHIRYALKLYAEKDRNLMKFKFKKRPHNHINNKESE